MGELATCGAPGGPTVLIVAGSPTRADVEERRPLSGRVGALVRPLVRKHWQGEVVLDLATRCYGKEVSTTPNDACRPHLARTIEEKPPDRIIALGGPALYSLTGRGIRPLNSRRGYTWLWNGGKPVPVFFVLAPTEAIGNRFLAKFFEEDFAWALTAKLPQPKHLESGAFTSLVASVEEAREAAKELARGEGFAFDLEWAGFLWDPEFRILSLAASPVGKSRVWAWDEAAINDDRFEPIAELLKDPEVPKGGSNVKADQHALWCGKRLRVKGVAFDTRLQRKLLAPDCTANLEDMAELVGMGGHKQEAETALDEIEASITAMHRDKKKRAKSTQGELAGLGSESLDAAMRLGFDVSKYVENPRAIAYAFLEHDVHMRYVSKDALTTARLASLYSGQLMRAPERLAIWEKIVLPASQAIQRVEEWGVPYDAQAGHLFQQAAQMAMDAAYAKVQHYAEPGKELNPGSPIQLAQALYDRLGLKPPYSTATGAPSTDEGALRHLQGETDNPLPAYVLEYRHYQKLIGYAQDWDRCVRADGRVHPSIHLDGARSGRTSCSEPNLQNIPRAADSDDGKRARNCFRAPHGKVMVQLDYSQLELRIACLLSRDKAMADLFRSGEDFHMSTAKLISTMAWGIPPERVTKVHRTGAKAFNFGLAYGKHDRTLAAELGITEEKAAQIRKAIFGSFVDFGHWTRNTIGYARSHGGCWTQWEGERARWRPLTIMGALSKDDRNLVNGGERKAVNTPIQGTASDFCVASIVKLVDLIEAGKMDAEVILPIHDSVMLLCPKETWKDTAEQARQTMMSYPWATDFVPLDVDVEVGEQWGDLEKVKPA